MLLSSKLSPSSSSNITESGDNSRGGLGSGGIGAESVVALLPSDVCSCLLIETNVLPLLPLLRPSTELLLPVPLSVFAGTCSSSGLLKNLCVSRSGAVLGRGRDGAGLRGAAALLLPADAAAATDVALVVAVEVVVATKSTESFGGRSSGIRQGGDSSPAAGSVTMGTQPSSFCCCSCCPSWEASLDSPG